MRSINDIEQNLISELFNDCQNDVNTLTDILIEISVTNSNNSNDQNENDEIIDEDLVEISYENEEELNNQNNNPTFFQRLFNFNSSNTDDEKGNYIQLSEFKKNN